jgi:hypothetical protein
MDHGEEKIGDEGLRQEVESAGEQDSPSRANHCGLAHAGCSGLSVEILKGFGISELLEC